MNSGDDLMILWCFQIIRMIFLGHPMLSLTPGAVFRIQCFISSSTLWYTTGSRQQFPGVVGSGSLAAGCSHLLKTAATVYLCQFGFLPPWVSFLWWKGKMCKIYLSFSFTMRGVPLSPSHGLPIDSSGERNSPLKTNFPCWYSLPASWYLAPVHMLDLW